MMYVPVQSKTIPDKCAKIPCIPLISTDFTELIKFHEQNIYSRQCLYIFTIVYFVDLALQII